MTVIQRLLRGKRERNFLSKIFLNLISQLTVVPLLSNNLISWFYLLYMYQLI